MRKLTERLFGDPEERPVNPRLVVPDDDEAFVEVEMPPDQGDADQGERDRP